MVELPTVSEVGMTVIAVVALAAIVTVSVVSVACVVAPEIRCAAFSSVTV